MAVHVILRAVLPVATGTGSVPRFVFPYVHRPASIAGAFAHLPNYTPAVPVNIRMHVDPAHRPLPVPQHFPVTMNIACAGDLAVAATNPHKYLLAGNRPYTRPVLYQIAQVAVLYSLCPAPSSHGCASPPVMASPPPQIDPHQSPYSAAPVSRYHAQAEHRPMSYPSLPPAQAQERGVTNRVSSQKN